MKYEKYFSYRRGRVYPAPGLLFSFKTKFNIKVWINQKKRILVTGGAGFIGANLCKKLLDAGYKVAAIDNLITSSGQNLTELSKNPNFKFIKHDITKPFPKTFNFSLSAFNFIYHLACPTGVENLTRLAREMLITCSVGTQNVMEFALKHKAKVVFTSSSEVYGDPKVFPQKEDYAGNVNPVGIRSPYEEGKRFAESLVTAYVRKYNLNAVIARVFNTYGPKMSENDTRVIPKFLRQAARNQPLTVQGDGTQTRTFCYVDDLIDALIRVMEKGRKGEVYNLGSDKEMTIKDLAKLIIKISKSKNRIKFIKRPVHDHNRRLPDLSKIKKLGWKQKVNLKEGLLKTIQSYN